MAKRTPRSHSAFEPFEADLQARGYVRTAGLDEAGRGCLAGPVVAAAVILPHGIEIPGLNDSKQLSAEAREALYPRIFEVALGVGVGIGSIAEIETHNILHASLRAMVKAVQALPIPPDFLLIDGNQPVPSPLPQQSVVKGDSRALCIAAASVVAKVHRDRLMVALEAEAPGYGFAVHKGYGTEAHREAIAALGPSIHHRPSFKGVREYLEVEPPPRQGRLFPGRDRG